jgi:hypothetical protein
MITYLIVKIDPKQLAANRLQVGMPSIHLLVVEHNIAIGIGSDYGERLIERTNLDPVAHPVLDLDL